MDLSRADWLRDFMDRLLAGYHAEWAQSRLAPWTTDPEAPLRMRVYRHLEIELRRSGLIFGSPRLPPRITQGTRFDRAEALFLGVLAGECLLALDVARICRVPFDPFRAEAELTLFLAVGAGEVELASRVHDRVLARTGGARELEKLQVRVGRALLERKVVATGDTTFDLPLHNASVYGEARMISRVAFEWLGRKRFRPEAVRRLGAAVSRERAALLESLLSLTTVRHGPTERERRALRRELGKLSLPKVLAKELRESLAHPLQPAALALRIRTWSLRRFVLEQGYLGAIADGLVEESERGFLDELARHFGVSADGLAAIEAQVAEFFSLPDDVLDAFAVQEAGSAVSSSVVDRIARELVDNMDKVANEIRETGELTQLLAKAARGQKLTPEERAKAREQLIDLAKVVPSLAIIAAPGGMLLFAALLKVLPFSLLPSSFQKPAAAAVVPQGSSKNRR